VDLSAKPSKILQGSECFFRESIRTKKDAQGKPKYYQSKVARYTRNLLKAQDLVSER
jgi:hypothetical protein